MAKKVVTKVIMDSGEKCTLLYDPAEVIEKFTCKDGKIRDEFIEMGIFYINPKHVSMMCYEEAETDVSDGIGNSKLSVKWENCTSPK